MVFLQIETFEDIERDQLLCVSTGKAFKKPRVQMLDVEVKASWGRARREYGPSATDVRVDAKGNPKVDVSFLIIDIRSFIEIN